MSKSDVSKETKHKTQMYLAAARRVKSKQDQLLKSHNEILDNPPSSINSFDRRHCHPRRDLMMNTDMLNTPKFTQSQLHDAAVEIIESPTQIGYLYMSGEDIVTLVTQYRNSSFACMYGDKAISITSPDGAVALINYGAGLSMSITSDVTLSEMLLSPTTPEASLSSMAEQAKCLTSAIACLDANAPNNDTHIGGR